MTSIFTPPSPSPRPASSLMRQTDPKAAKKPLQAGNPPKFGSVGSNVQNFGRRVMDHFDFQEFGASHVNQIQLIYGTCITWRLLAANERRKQSSSKSWNEIRESALRDSLGLTFWFFATPILQRLFLQGVSKKNPALGQALVRENPEVRKASGVLGALKRLSPLTRLDIPTSEQVKDQMEQALHALKTKGVGKTDAAYAKTERFYKDLLKYRNFATALGLGTTIALLGIGINALNFYLTRRNMERRQKEMQANQALPAFKPPDGPTPPPAPLHAGTTPKPSNPFTLPAGRFPHPPPFPPPANMQMPLKPMPTQLSSPSMPYYPTPPVAPG